MEKDIFRKNMKLLFTTLFVIISFSSSLYGKELKTLEKNINKILNSVNARPGFALIHIESNDKILIRENELFTLASVRKVPNMVAVGKAIMDEKISWNDRISLTDDVKVEGASGIIQELPSGIDPTIKYLTEIMISVSDGTATEMIFQKLGMDWINPFLKSIGLQNTNIDLSTAKYFAHPIREAIVIKSLNNQTTEEIMVTDIPYQAENLTLSPDKSRIAFVQSYDIWIKDLKTNTMTQITNDNFRQKEPCWSPDGKKLAFSSNINGNYDIWIWDEKDNSLHQLTISMADETEPAWSPDGKKIAYSWRYRNLVNLRYADLKEKKEYLLTDFNIGGNLPIWSPDGEKIVFQSKNNIWILDLNRKKIKKLTAYEGNNWNPGFSSDGDSVIFESDMDKNFDLWEISLRGGIMKKLTDDIWIEKNPILLKDENKLIYTRIERADLNLKHNTSTPYDIALLLKKIYEKTILTPEICEKFVEILSKTSRASYTPRFIPSNVKFIWKGGSLPRVRTFAGILYFGENSHCAVSIFFNDIHGDEAASSAIGEILKTICDFYTQK
ncbi:MAG: serine hydrolase [Acidobacteriota bacterium]